MTRWLKSSRPWSLAVAAAVLLLAGGGVVADGKRAHTATLTVIVELMADETPAAGVFAVYGPSHELRTSGKLVAERPFTVTARPGDRLFFALPAGVDKKVFRPQGEGIDLFNGAGRPITGNVTALVGLYDQAGKPTTLAPSTQIAKLIRVTIH